MANRNEYLEIVTVTKSSLEEMMYAQNEVIDEGFGGGTEAGLAASLATVSGILDVLFNLGPATTVANVIFSLLVALAPNEKEMLESDLNNGIRGMLKLHEWFKYHPEYDAIKVKMSFAEYPDYEDVRFVTHTDDDYIVAVHGAGGWIY